MWWSYSGWFWFPTPNPTMNFSATDFEWLMMPSLVLTHSDRFLFLINLAGFILMPGLLFSVLAGAGVSRRVAWAWMWLLPLGFCYLLQAGSMGNDTLGATFILAALHFAFRARKTRNAGDLCLALVAAGLATGTKVLNLPLLLPVFVALWPVLGLLRSRIVLAVAAIAFSLAVSFCPMAALNVIHTGNWAGDPRNEMGAQAGTPVAGILGNSLLLTQGFISPPFWPYPRQFSELVRRHFPAAVTALLKRDLPRFVWDVREMPQEEGAGLGLGITILLGAVFFTKRACRGAAGQSHARPGMFIGLMAWVALLIYMSKIGSEATCRLVSAYYPLLFLPIFLIPGQRALVRQRWWRTVGILSGVASLLVAVATPSRPLWPAGTICDRLATQFPHLSEFARARTVYSVYDNRNRTLASLPRHIPESVLTFGVIGGDDEAYGSLWQPYGKREVRFLTGSDVWRHPGLDWVVVNQEAAELLTGGSFDLWLRKTGGSVVACEVILSKASRAPDTWCVVHFHDL
jgi:hypothetical protein